MWRAGLSRHLSAWVSFAGSPSSLTGDIAQLAVVRLGGQTILWLSPTIVVASSLAVHRLNQIKSNSFSVNSPKSQTNCVSGL